MNSDPHDVSVGMFYWRRRFDGARELAGMTLKPDVSRLFLQFASRCDEKERLAADLIGFWRSKGLDLPTFERLVGPIVPSPDTIDLRGPYWADPATPLPQHPEGPTNI